MYDGVRRLSVLMIVCCVALLLTYWLRGSQKEYGLFHLLRGEPAPLPPAAAGEGSPGPSAFTPGTDPPVDLDDVDVLAKLSRQMARLAASVVPSVVSIETEKRVDVNRVVDSPLFSQDLVIPERGIEPGQGSGVIVSAEGHVVTNFHVVEDAGAITVMIADRRRQFAASVLGADPVVDIAVLKLDVEPDMRFPPLPLGDSGRVRQGDMVFSVGSPFGLDGTFTDGVISSAVPRRISDSAPPLFQTNTILNQGNSGGPLVNVMGEVIGINSAIYNGAGQMSDAGNAYGLAIPSNDVRAAMERILNQGVPSYGYLGVYLKDVYMEEALVLGLQRMEGCVVNGTLAGSPAYHAGLRKDDVILRFDGKAFDGIHELVQMIQTTSIGSPVTLTVVRDREEIEITAVIRGNGSVEIPEPAKALVDESWERTGLRVAYVAASERRRHGYEPSQPMVEITEVRPSSVAEGVGLHPGLLIHFIDDLPTQTPKEFYEVLHQRGKQEDIKLTISPPGRRGSMHLRMPLG